MTIKFKLFCKKKMNIKMRNKMNRKEYDKELEDIKKRIEKLEQVEIEEDKVWKPEHMNDYWYIDSFGNVYEDKWIHFGDEFRYSVGNVFKTKEEAKHEVERRKVISELKQFSRKFKYGLANYYIDYDYTNDIITYMLCYTDFIPTICFESNERFREAVEAVGEDRIKKYLFEVEE